MIRAGRIAYVTGGTGAIGTAICAALARAGARVAAIGHPAEAERLPAWREALRAQDVEAEVELADLADFAATTAAFARLAEKLGPADILVNGAGITRDARFVNLTPAQWREVLGANLDSVFNACKSVFAGMCARGYGRIVNLSSVNGQRGQFGQTNYAAAKAGMHGFTMSLAQEGAAHGVTVNTVAPGYVATPMTAAMKPEALARITAQIPLKRLAQPEEIARAVLFLCEEEAGYLTGACLPVNGGLYMSA